jgi:hypothetical protein
MWEPHIGSLSMLPRLDLPRHPTRGRRNVFQRSVFTALGRPLRTLDIVRRHILASGMGHRASLSIAVVSSRSAPIWLRLGSIRPLLPHPCRAGEVL